MSNRVRLERDTFGPIEVAGEALWGAQTQRSLQFFNVSTEKMPRALLLALVHVKRAAAQANVEVAQLPLEKADAIVKACDEVLAGQHDGQFPLSVWQTGSGTQTNMNVNEVLNDAEHISSDVVGDFEQHHAKPLRAACVSHGSAGSSGAASGDACGTFGDVCMEARAFRSSLRASPTHRIAARSRSPAPPRRL